MHTNTHDQKHQENKEKLALHANAVGMPCSEKYGAFSSCTLEAQMRGTASVEPNRKRIVCAVDKKEARRRWWRAYYAKNKEKLRAYKNAYYEKHPDRKRKPLTDEKKVDRYARAQEWRHANRERYLELQKAWRQKNKERLNEKQKAYQAKRWRTLVDDEAKHEEYCLKRHNRLHPEVPYCPHYKRRVVASWRMGRAFRGYVFPDESQKAYAKELFAERREKMKM